MDPFIDESVEELYTNPDIVTACEQMEEDMQTAPQEYGVVEATLFDD